MEGATEHIRTKVYRMKRTKHIMQGQELMCTHEEVK